MSNEKKNDDDHKKQMNNELFDCNEKKRNLWRKETNEIFCFLQFLKFDSI